MPSPVILRFYDYYEAHLAAHQLQLEGQTAEVFDYTLSTSVWPGGGFRLLVFEPSEIDEEAGEIEVGVLGNVIDTILRMLVLAISGMTPVWMFFSMLAEKPRLDVEILIYAPLVFVLWLAGALVTVEAYDDFRAGGDFGRVVILGVGWCICIGYLLNFAIIVNSVVRLLIGF